MTLNTSNFVEESSNEVPTIPHELIIQQPAKDGDKSPMVTTQVLPAEAVNHLLRWGQALLERQPQIQLQIHGQIVTITLKDMLIAGRYNAANNDRPEIDLEPYGALNKGVSRHHAAFLVEGHIIKIMDMDSANGTFLNGFKLLPYQARVLRDGDELRLGHLVMNIKFMTLLEI